MIEVCARTEANVLLLGETGCGKDLISQAIHGLSHRRELSLRQGRLHALSGEPHRERALRSRKRLVHRGRAAPQGPLRTGRKRHALSRRRGRHPAGAAVEAPAGDRGEGLRAGRRHNAHQGRRADHRLHEAEPAGKDRRRDVSPGPLLSARRAADRGAALARADGRPAAAGRAPAQGDRRRVRLRCRAGGLGQALAA